MGDLIFNLKKGPISPRITAYIKIKELYYPRKRAYGISESNFTKTVSKYEEGDILVLDLPLYYQSADRVIITNETNKELDSISVYYRNLSSFFDIFYSYEILQVNHEEEK